MDPISIHNENNKYADILSNFIKYDDKAFRYEPNELYKLNDEITILNYTLYSQKWPVNNEPTISSIIWTHHLIIYVPTIINKNYKNALMHVNGGKNKGPNGEEALTTSGEALNYQQIAVENKIPVINLQQVPNQYLFMDGEYKKEDDMLAYSYKLFMSNPDEHQYIPGHLPMAKTIITAMDASQEILQNELDIKIDNYILSGFSKRGWAVWLSSIEDQRVKGVIPGVIDILNVKESLNHICNFYKDGCPLALKAYKKEGILDRLDSEEFKQLVDIEDPFSYLQEGYDNKYREQFAKLSKYIINSVGDDFYVPDSSKHYFQYLPGNQNYIRYLPNSFHYLGGNPIADQTDNLNKVCKSISSFVNFINNDITLPLVKWNISSTQIDIYSSSSPKRAILWTYNNENECDFRFIASYSYLSLAWKYIKYYLGFRLGDRYFDPMELDLAIGEYENFEITVELPKFKYGCQASFVELIYDINKHEFNITSEVSIVAKDDINFKPDL